MRIAVLGSPESWYVADLRRAAEIMDIELVPVPFSALCGRVFSGEGTIAAGPLELNHVDRVLVRTMPPGTLEQVVFRMDALHRLESSGVPILNPPRAIECAVDKYLATAKLSAAGLPVPPTVACETAEQAQAAFEQLGGDVVVKPLFGSEGRGMVRVSDPDLAFRTFRTLERTGAVLYLQQFLPHADGDIRALVLGDRVVAAMRRSSAADWRTNVARGAIAEPITLGDDDRRCAVNAARSVGAPLAGVDLLPAGDSVTYVLEVNAVPGWRALHRVTGSDVAAAVLQYVVGTRWRTSVLPDKLGVEP